MRKKLGVIPTSINGVFPPLSVGQYPFRKSGLQLSPSDSEDDILLPRSNHGFEQVYVSAKHPVALSIAGPHSHQVVVGDQEVFPDTKYDTPLVAVNARVES
jgi:hypothetical protein